MGHHSFNKLRDKMSPKQRSEAHAEAKQMMAEMLLAELRKSVGMTQEELADKLGIKQPSLSKLESQDDIQVSTLQRLIEGLGGQLEIVAHMPRGDIRINQFQRTQ
jgi:predicted transcriptional regulator